MSRAKHRLQKPQTTTISHELDFGAGAPLTKEFPALSSLPFDKSLAITKYVLDRVIVMAAKESGAVVKLRIYGPGGYEGYVNPSAQTQIHASRRALHIFIDIVGYLSEQTEVYASSPSQSGSMTFIQIRELGSNKLATCRGKIDFFNRLRETEPKLKGFMPFLDAEGNHGIRILRADVKWSDADIGRFLASAEKIAQNMSVKGRVTSGRLSFLRARNDWKKHPNGESYLRRAAKAGRAGIQRRMDSTYRPAVRRRLEEAFQKYAAQELQAFRKATRPRGPVRAARKERD